MLFCHRIFLGFRGVFVHQFEVLQIACFLTASLISFLFLLTHRFRRLARSTHIRMKLFLSKFIIFLLLDVAGHLLQWIWFDLAPCLLWIIESIVMLIHIYWLNNVFFVINFISRIVGWTICESVLSVHMSSNVAVLQSPNHIFDDVISLSKCLWVGFVPTVVSRGVDAIPLRSILLLNCLTAYFDRQCALLRLLLNLILVVIVNQSLNFVSLVGLRALVVLLLGNLIVKCFGFRSCI